MMGCVPKFGEAQGDAGDTAPKSPLVCPSFETLGRFLRHYGANNNFHKIDEPRLPGFTPLAPTLDIRIKAVLAYHYSRRLIKSAMRPGERTAAGLWTLNLFAAGLSKQSP